MATRTWNSGASTDGNLATNYDGEGGLLATDDIVYDATSVINCTFTGAFSVASITVAAGYTGVFNDGAQAVTTSGAVSITPGGTFTGAGTWTQTGDANFTLASTGTWSTTNWSIVLQGTGTIKFKSWSSALPADLTCAANGKTTTVTSFAVHAGITNSLTVGAGTLTVNTNLYLKDFSGTGFTVDASATIGGTGRIVIYNNSASNLAMTIPALTTTLPLLEVLKAGSAGTVAFTMGGAISAVGFNVYTGAAAAVGAMVFNTGDNAITASTDFSWGANNTGNNTLTMNMGASVVTTGTYCATAYNSAGTLTLNMGTSQWTCTGAWTNQSNHTIVPGLTSVINFTGLNSTFTTAGKNFGGIVYNKNAGQTLTQAGALNCAALTVAGGNFTSGNNAITASGNVLMGGGTLNLGTSAVTCTGNAITARISATTRTTATSVWTFSGTSAVLDLANGGATTISRLILQAAAAYTWTATANVLTISTYTATDWDSTTWTSGTPGTSAAILAPAGVVVTGTTVTDSNNSGVTIDASDATNADGGGNTGWTFPVTDQNMVGQTMAGAAGAAGGAGM